MRSIKRRQSKPIANISSLFNGLRSIFGLISGKNKWIEVSYAQH